MVMWSEVLANPYMRAGLILLGAVIVAKLFQAILVRYLRHLTSKTETDIDDILLEIASRPLFFLFVLLGLYAAVHTIEVTTGYARWVDAGFYILVVLFLAWLLARILGFLITRWFQAHRGMSGTPQILNVIVAVIIYLAAFIVVLSHFEVEVTPFIATLGVGGLAVGLALQGTLSNIFAGIHILSDQPVKVGDFIEIENGTVAGHVTDISWRSTRIKTPSNNIVIVPNSKLSESIVTNFALPTQKTTVAVACGVDYASDLEKVEKTAIRITKDLMKSTPGMDGKFEPVVRFFNFGSDNVEFRLIVGVNRPDDRFVVQHELVKAVHKRFAKEGIEISWPVRKVYQMGATGKKRR